VTEPTRPSGRPRLSRHVARAAAVRAGSAADWPLVGRGEELELVESALHADGAHGVVIAGVAGVGKSRLASECAAQAEAAGMARAAALQGDLATAEEQLSQARDTVAARVPGKAETYELERAKVAVSLARGDLSRARGLALRYADESGEAILHEAEMLHEAVRAGHPVAQVEGRLAILAARSDAALTSGLAEHAHALATRDVAALEQVGEEFADLGLQLLAAETTAEASVAATRTGLSASARRLAARSHALAGRCEGARTPILASVKTIELTPRELEIALLASGNLSNREIADRLVVSQRTVETHIYRVMDKLGVSRRQELGPLLQ
jgi:DNA-binding CsgD family transcriptional regulator